MWVKILKGFAVVWAGGVGLLILFDATPKSQWWFGPFHVANLHVTLLCLSPAAIAWFLAERYGSADLKKGLGGE